MGALRDRTWAGTRVYDSDQTPLADAIRGEANAPYIVVYSDADDKMNVKGKELYDGSKRLMTLVIEIAVASSVTHTDTNGNTTTTTRLANTDEGMEWSVDIIESQALAALVGDPKSDWGDIFKRIVYSTVRIPSRRGGSGEKGLRFAARRTALICTTMDEVVPGQVLQAGHPVLDFIALARAKPQSSVVDAATIVENILNNVTVPDWRLAQAYLGLSTASAKAVNVQGVPLPWPEQETPPLDTSDTNEFPPLMVEIDLDDGVVSPSNKILP